jgi:hypothetical protein
MRYELWKYEDEYGVGWTFMPVDHQYVAFLRYKEKYDPSSELVWTVDAETRDEAIAGYHEFMGGSQRRKRAVEDLGEWQSERCPVWKTPIGNRQSEIGNGLIDVSHQRSASRQLKFLVSLASDKGSKPLQDDVAVQLRCQQ